MRYECTEDGASKFWEIQKEGKAVTTRWGKIGTDGQTKTNTFPTEEKANAEMDKLISSKLGKGYRRLEDDKSTREAKPSAPDRRSLKSAADVEGFLGALLAENDADRAVLKKLMARFTAVAAHKDRTELSFKEERVLIIRALDEPFSASAPASIRALPLEVADLSTECGGGGCIASGCAYSVSDYLNDEDGNLGEDVDPDEVPGVFDHGQNLVVAHPKKKNARKEPLLYFIDHEDGQPRVMEAARSLSARQVLLRLFTQSIVGEEYFEDLSE